MRRLAPIRKVAVGLIASAVYYAAHRAGLTLVDDQAANQAAQGLVGFVAAYLVPDPRVQGLERRVGLVAKVRLLLDYAEHALLAPEAKPKFADEADPASFA